MGQGSGPELYRLLCLDCGILLGIVACCFALPGFPGKVSVVVEDPRLSFGG